MLDKSIDGALLALRKQIIRGKLDGLDHVEALLVLGGVDMPAVLPARRSCAAGRGQGRALVLDALRDGPKRRGEIVRHVAENRPEIPAEVAYDRVDKCLWKMRKAGLIVRVCGPDGCLWKAMTPPKRGH